MFKYIYKAVKMTMKWLSVELVFHLIRGTILEIVKAAILFRTALVIPEGIVIMEPPMPISAKRPQTSSSVFVQTFQKVAVVILEMQ